MLFRVSSAAIQSASRNILTARYVISSKFPIGVAHRYNVPAIDLHLLPIPVLFLRYPAQSLFPSAQQITPQQMIP